MEDIHKLRFAVYCKEKQYLDASRYPDGREYDEFDAYSVHFAARDSAGKIVATLRLVIPSAEQRFPYEDFCAPMPDVVLPPKGRVAEISRLIIAQAAREKQEKEGFSFSSLIVSRVDAEIGARDPELHRWFNRGLTPPDQAQPAA